MSPNATLWIWDDTNKEWVKLAGTAGGAMSIHAIVEELDDIEDVNAPTPADNEALTWDVATSKWIPEAPVPAAHKDSHDPQDGSDKLDTAAPVKVGSANAVGTSHSLARADHVHEREHAIYTDAAAKAAAVQAGAITDGVTKAPTHDAVYDVKVTADAALPTVDKYTDAEAVDAIEADGNLPVASITFIIGVIGTVITTGLKGDLEIPFACTINRVTLLANKSGSIVIDIWKQAYADYPPEDAQSITASAPPTITTAEKSQDSTLTGWTTAIAAGDCLRFNVDSITDIEQVTLSLKVTKT